MSNEGSRDRQVPYFIWEVFFPHWQCLTFPYHSRLVNGWSASPPENKRVSRLFSVTIYRGPLSPARRKQEFPEDTRVKCLKESDMMLPQMGTVLTSEGTQPVRRGVSPTFEVSVVIPCLNEASSLAYCVDKAMKAFQAAGLSGEVVVADNGSTDDSIRIAEELREGNDMVMGNRFRGEIKPGAMPPLHKYFGNPGLTALLNTLFHVHIGDSYCGMRGFTRSLYDRLDLRSSGMEFALEMVIKSAQIGARIAEIPIILWPDKR